MQDLVQGTLCSPSAAVVSFCLRLVLHLAAGITKFHLATDHQPVAASGHGGPPCTHRQRRLPEAPEVGAVTTRTSYRVSGL